MDTLNLKNGLRIDNKHLDDLQALVEASIDLGGSMLNRSVVPSVPGTTAGALCGFATTYTAVSHTIVLAGTVGATRSIAVAHDGTIIEMLSDSTAIDISAFDGGSLPFYVWGDYGHTLTTPRDQVVFTSGVGEAIDNFESVDAKTIAFVAQAPATPAPSVTAFIVTRCVNWTGPVPNMQLCGPLRDLTSHSVALDTSKPKTIADALFALATNAAVQHYPAGHALAGQHGMITSFNGNGLDPLLLLIGATNIWGEQVNGDRLRFLVAGGATGGVTIRSKVGDAGCLTIFGETGPSNDLGVGEEAHLRFGKDDESPWTDSRDFAMIATGAAADSGRKLEWWVGAPAVMPLRLTQAKVLTPVTVGYGYTTPLLVYRSIDPSAFQPFGNFAYDDYAYGNLNAIGPHWRWQRLLWDLGGLSHFGWGVIDDDAPGDITDVPSTMSTCVLVAPLDWLPDGSVITTDLVYLAYETNAAWANLLSECHYTVAIMKRQTSFPASYTCLAYTRFTPIHGPNNLDEYSSAWVGGGTIVHASYTYSLIIMADSSAAVPPATFTGGFSWFGLRIPYRRNHHEG